MDEASAVHHERRGLTNGLILGGLAVASAWAVLRVDLAACAALYTYGDVCEVSKLETSLALLARLPADWLEWYDGVVLTSPVFVKACTSGVCYYLGDVLAQTLAAAEASSDGDVLGALDLTRSTRSAAAGFVGHGPVAHAWLNLLDSLDVTGPGAVALKILLDQGPMSIFYNTVYTALIGAFAFRNPKEVVDDIQRTWWPSMAVSLRFWPLAHLVTFSNIIPLHLQLLYIDVMEIIWIAILSKVNNDGKTVITSAEDDGDDAHNPTAAAD